MDKYGREWNPKEPSLVHPPFFFSFCFFSPVHLTQHSLRPLGLEEMERNRMWDCAAEAPRERTDTINTRERPSCGTSRSRVLIRITRPRSNWAPGTQANLGEPFPLSGWLIVTYRYKNRNWSITLWLVFRSSWSLRKRGELRNTQNSSLLKKLQFILSFNPLTHRSD